MSITEQFELNYIPEPNSGCWLWLGGHSRNRAVYLQTTAARVSWKLYIGLIPIGLDVLHRCDNPLCVNPDHLFVGTHSDNMVDMVKKDRHAKVKKRGEAHGITKLSDHDFTEIVQLRGHMTAKEIAEAYGVTPAYVSHIQLGRYKR
jgi:HNH endonuclease